MVRPKFSEKFLNNFFFKSCVKLLRNFVPMNFSEKFIIGALGVKFQGNFVPMIFPDIWNRSSGVVLRNLQKISGPKISWKFSLQNSPAILAPEILQQRIPNFTGIFATNFFKSSCFHFAGNLIRTKYSNKLSIGALGLYSEILREFRKFRSPKFPRNFRVRNLF